jgi:hypothetical protein
MYERDTILTLKEQRDPDPETGEEFAYNKVQVIGPSPVSHADKGDWTGSDAAGVIIVPLANFGGTLDEPFGKLRELYDVTEIPEFVAAQQPEALIRTKQGPPKPTPEDVFKAEAPGTPPEEGQTRARSKPLGDPGGPANVNGPLGPAPSRNKAGS